MARLFVSNSPDRNASAYYYMYLVGPKIPFTDQPTSEGDARVGWRVDTRDAGLCSVLKKLAKDLAGKTFVFHGPSQQGSDRRRSTRRTDQPEFFTRMKLFFADMNDFLQGRANVEEGLLARLRPYLPPVLAAIESNDEFDTLVACIDDLCFYTPSALLANDTTLKDLHGSNAVQPIHAAELAKALRKGVNRCGDSGIPFTC